MNPVIFTSNDRQEWTYWRFTPNSGLHLLPSPSWKNWLTSVLVGLCGAAILPVDYMSTRLYMSHWQASPVPSGYCGADIKAVCSEAALCALRRRYPQIYSSSQKLVLDVDSIAITSRDFVTAMSKMVPASQRCRHRTRLFVLLFVSCLYYQYLVLFNDSTSSGQWCRQLRP